MPTLKAIHICNSLQPKHKPKIAKEYVFANAETQPKKKYDRTTMAIRNAGLSAEMKVIALNKLSAKLKGKCVEIPHYA
jgi:hypothetical protein